MDTKRQCQFSNTTILLAPYILDNIKPLELPYFIDSFTNYNKDNSKGCLYLLYKYKDIINYRIINGVCSKQKHFFNIKIIKYNNNLFILVKFMLKNSNNFENIKKYGNLSYTKHDFIELLDFWNQHYFEIRHILLEQITDLFNLLDEERLDNKSSLLFLFTCDLFLIIITLTLNIL